MLTIVVGAQFGGEGKGKVAAYLATQQHFDWVCRCGGPNSSHTVVWNGRTFRLRMMPTATITDLEVNVCFGSGTLIHIPTLLSELRLLRKVGFKGQLWIDRQAGIITDSIVQEQRKDPRYETLGSTLSGTGYATAKRATRQLRLAKEFEELSEYMTDVSELLNNNFHEQKILLEGHQGYGLSNYHGDYPYTSSRDTTAASMLAEVGLGPIQKQMTVVLVTKMFPTRNHAGKLDAQMTTRQADALGIVEFGGGSWGIEDRRRRVGLLDFDIIKRAAAANSATEIALTGIDYYLRAFATTEDGNEHFLQTKQEVERITNALVRYLSFGADTKAMIDLHDQSGKAMTHKLGL